MLLAAWDTLSPRRPYEAIMAEIRTLPLAALIPATYNPRTISDAALAGLRKSIERFDLVQPIIWNERTANIVGGHQRVKALQQLGRTEAQVVVVDLPESEEKALNVALNSPAIAGEFTDDLQALLADIEASDAALFADLRLSELKIDIEFESTPLLTDPDEVPDPPAEPITKPGDLWLLGGHRVLCGDSTVATDVERLLAGAAPQMMVTDPPYGVNYDPDWRNRADRANGKPDCARAIGLITNDDRADWADSYALFPGDVAYVWHPPGAIQGIFLESLERCGFEIRITIVWAKNQFPIGRGHYHVKHEPCFYAVRKNKAAGWIGDRKQTTLWEIDKPRKSETGHGSQKPVECMARPMRNHEASEVYDPFLGSGTTLIAAEQLGRRCYGMEISPAYCDVIVKRWEQATGKKATLEAANH